METEMQGQREARGSEGRCGGTGRREWREDWVCERKGRQEWEAEGENSLTS